MPNWQSPSRGLSCVRSSMSSTRLSYLDHLSPVVRSAFPQVVQHACAAASFRQYIETEGFWICVNKDTLTPSRLTDIARFGSTTENHRSSGAHGSTGPNIDEYRTPFPLRRTDIDPFEHVNNIWHGVHELCQIPT